MGAENGVVLQVTKRRGLFGATPSFVIQSLLFSLPRYWGFPPSLSSRSPAILVRRSPPPLPIGIVRPRAFRYVDCKVPRRRAATRSPFPRLGIVEDLHAAVGDVVSVVW